MFNELKNKHKNLYTAILTNKYENHFNEQLLSVLDEVGKKSIVFAGRANAGKSSLINKLIKNKSLTTSKYPGTTLEEIIIDYEQYQFIDTPGLIDMNNYATYLSKEKYALLMIDKTIRPKVFQLNEPQSYFYYGLLRVDVIPKDNCSISFYINNNNEIHRSKYEKADDYYNKHYQDFLLRVKQLSFKEFTVEDCNMYMLKGVGFFKIMGKSKIKIHYLQDVLLYESEVDI